MKNCECDQPQEGNAANHRQCRDAEVDGEVCVNSEGGWTTFPFIIGSVMGLTMAASSWYSNIMIYAICKYNMKPIAAAQINNIAGGGMNFFPIIGAILADSLFGPFTIITISAFICLLGSIMLTLSAALPALKPPLCMNSSLQMCEPPSSSQYAYLYATLAVFLIGNRGTRFVIGGLGASQFQQPQEQRVFFNWFIFSIEITKVFNYTVLVYLQDNVSWTLSFGIRAGANFVAVILFLLGSRYYRLTKPNGSPFITITRVLIASLRKKLEKPSTENEEADCHERPQQSNKLSQSPLQEHRFVNEVVKKGDKHEDETLTTSWYVCTFEEVEDARKLLKVLPIWFSGVLISTITAAFSSFVVLHALSMDRRVGVHFKIPAASMLVFNLLTGSITICFLDRVAYPMWQSKFGKPLPTLSKIGIGNFFIFISMVFAGLVAKKWHDLLWSHPTTMNDPSAESQMHVLWLVIPLILLGIGTGFRSPSEVAFYYEQLPKSLKSTATALASLHFAVGFYLGAALTNLLEKHTSWLPQNTNLVRIDKVQWTLAIIGVINFGYFVICTKLYKYNHLELNDEKAVVN